MLFKYRVKNQEGKVISGTVEARSETEAIRLLRERGFFVINLSESKVELTTGGLASKLSRVAFGDIVNFTRQLSTMVTAGLPLVDSLDLLKTQTKNLTLRRILTKILEKVQGGETLASALGEHPKHFNKIYLALIRAGESSGKLDTVLERLADNLEKERKFRGKIKGAMIYPTIIILAMTAVMFLMMTVVVPKLTGIYKEFDVKLPLPTIILMTISDVFVKFWWLILLALLGLFFLFSRWKKTEVGRRILDKFILHLPIWGSLKREALLAEMTRTLGLLAGAGISLLEALRIVADAVDSESYSEAIKKAAVSVEKGFPLGLTVSRNPLFPALLGQMITVGEETGKIDETLLRVSGFFETSASEKVKGLTTAIEPIIMVILGVGVGFLVLSIVLPMYQLTEAFQ